MRQELAEILCSRYGEGNLTTTTLVLPTQKQLTDYERHHGLVSLWINLESSPHLVIIDTAGFKHLRHAWIGARQKEALRLVVSAGIQSVAVNRLRTYTYAQRLEGLELTMYYHYHYGQRRDIPYLEDLRPLW